ncbi:MAG TPA: SDR family oxidoreductase [Tepidisphaeraceae bacterium]|jgi:NAD(P)-dependent dehydrogenase (short-subunit alcohol dehydrogenase family)|nr:SDR family oxidoreductase [Tepidisphaeraceae bacterium]
MVLASRSLVVIGGTSGLGLSAAKAFIAAGAQVVVVGRKPDALESARQQLGNAALALNGDATDPKTALAAIQVALKNFGGFHGLYHVAGGSGRRMGDGPLHEISDDGWEYTLKENLTSMFYSNRAAVRQFLAQKSGGSILNMTSVLGYSPSAHYFGTHAYAASKAAIIGLTKSAAAYYASSNIRVNALAPALVATPMSERAQADAEILQFIATKQPLDGGRIGQPADLDAAAVFFMSDQSKFVTGQVLAVDGGWTVSEGQIPRREAPDRAAPTPKPANLIRKLAAWWVKMGKD